MTVINLDDRRKDEEKQYRENFGNLIKALKSAYPNFKIIENKIAFEMWLSMLQDIPLDMLQEAVYKHMATEEYPPSIAQLRKKALSAEVDLKDWSEAWGLFGKSVSKFGLYRATEALNWIREQDPLAANIIQRFGYQELCESDNQMADRAHFKTAYMSEQEKEVEYAQLPPQYRQGIEDRKSQLDELAGGLFK